MWFRVMWASVLFLTSRARQFCLMFALQSGGAIRGTRWGLYHGSSSCIVTVSEDGDILGGMLTCKTK